MMEPSFKNTSLLERKHRHYLLLVVGKFRLAGTTEQNQMNRRHLFVEAVKVGKA